MGINKLLILIFSISISVSAGLVGSFFTVTSVNSWYDKLNKPSFNPPNWAFGPVWIMLYIVMGISLYLVLTHREFSYWKKSSIVLFAIQLVLNALWSYVFFGMHNIGLALFIIASLIIVLVMMIERFSRIDRRAGLLLVPYLLWVGFATILNLAILNLN